MIPRHLHPDRRHKLVAPPSARISPHLPEVLVLDEPTDGLDPNQKELVRALVREMKPGRTIVLSTHILEEAEELCDRAVVIDRGVIVEDAKIDRLVDPSGRLAARFRELTLGV